MSSVFELSCDRYTYADYEEWDEDFRCELIDGIVYMMAAPTLWHQNVVLEVRSVLREFLKGKKCKPFVESGVRLFPSVSKTDKDVLLPDIIVVCDESKITGGKLCEGAPDIVFEVLSSSTRLMDLNVKNRFISRPALKSTGLLPKIMPYNGFGRMAMKRKYVLCVLMGL